MTVYIKFIYGQKVKFSDLTGALNTCTYRACDFMDNLQKDKTNEFPPWKNFTDGSATDSMFCCFSGPEHDSENPV